MKLIILCMKLIMYYVEEQALKRGSKTPPPTIAITVMSIPLFTSSSTSKSNDFGAPDNDVSCVITSIDFMRLTNKSFL